MNDELWDTHYELQKTVRSQAERIERLEAQLEKLEQLTDDILIKQVLKQGRNARMVGRIERLEQIILSMAAGSESSGGMPSGHHTHWVYPLRGSDLVGEIKGNLAETPVGNDSEAIRQAELDDPHYGGA